MKKKMNFTIAALALTCALSVPGICAQTDESASVFKEVSALEWSYCSGAGAWSTDLQIFEDGTFTGDYHDSEMGDMGETYPNGTVYHCAFSGRMSLGEQVDETTWEIKIDSLETEAEPGKETIDDGIRFIETEPCGISEGDTMQLYLPGTPADALTEDMRFWAHLPSGEDAPAVLEGGFLYSEKNESGFAGAAPFDTANMANPWQDLTQEELREKCGVPFGVPEEAENVIYRWLESEQLAEMQFTIGGDEFCARVEPAALQEGEQMNISGMYFAWENEESVQIGHCDGSLMQAQTGTSDWVQLCQWYDAAPGLMYSLSVYTQEPDGLDLTAVAEMVYVPVQE